MADPLAAELRAARCWAFVRWRQDGVGGVGGMVPWATGVIPMTLATCSSVHI